MATRSRIGRLNADGTVTSIYCHWDGYNTEPYGVGYILRTYYNDANLVDELIRLGDISSLGKKLYPETNTHSFDNPEKDVTLAYRRDRKEKGVGARKNHSEKAYLNCKHDWDIEYKYLWKNGKWECYNVF